MTKSKKMKFSCTIDINKPVNKVCEVFKDPNNLALIQKGFKSKEQLSGAQGKKGSKSKMIYDNMELIETILIDDLPDEFEALYEHKYMTNTMKVHMIPLTVNSTRYVTTVHYTKFNGFVPKIIAKVYPGLFKNQVNKWLWKFKEFTENK